MSALCADCGERTRPESRRAGAPLVIHHTATCPQRPHQPARWALQVIEPDGTLGSLTIAPWRHQAAQVEGLASIVTDRGATLVVHGVDGWLAALAPVAYYTPTSPSGAYPANETWTRGGGR